MAEQERKRITDGFATMERGVMEGRDPSLLAKNQAARLINTTVRGGKLTCRPPYSRFALNFADGEQALWFKTHNVQGREIYQSPSGQSSLVVSVGGRIFKIDVMKRRNLNVLELTPAGDANPTNRPHVWMVQAEQYLIIQDGQSPPLIYDGAVCRRSMLGAPRYEVPVGRAMAYGLGRLVVVRPHGRSYVIGDIVHGGTEVYQFTEDNYLNEGGDVTVPIQGEITALKILAQIDRSTGQGDLIVGTPYGAASARLGEKREEWKNIQFQLVAMLGAGPTSQNSMVLCNGDLFLRSRDGIRSLAMTRSEYQNSWSKTPLSREVSRTLSYDTQALLGFCDGALFDNRLLMLCNQTPLPNGCYHRGIIALDFDLISSMFEKQPPAYDGIWTGLRATALISGDFPDGERCFVFHRNDDDENELWEVLKDGVADNGITPIEWIIEGPALLKMASQPFALKNLQGGDISLQDMVGTVTVNVQFKPDQAPCWVDWYSKSMCAKTRVCDGECTAPVTYQPQYRTKKRFPQPPDQCSASDKKPARYGYEFQPRITMTGKATIAAVRFHATEWQEPVNEIDGCAEE